MPMTDVAVRKDKFVVVDTTNVTRKIDNSIVDVIDEQREQPNVGIKRVRRDILLEPFENFSDNDISACYFALRARL